MKAHAGNFLKLLFGQTDGFASTAGVANPTLSKAPAKDQDGMNVIRTYLEKRILVQDQGGAEFQPADILQYFEELEEGSNAEIALKNFFEIG